MDVPKCVINAYRTGENNFACAVCVPNTLVDVHSGPVVNCAVTRREGGMLALCQPWSSSIINDLITGGAGTNTTDSYRRVATYFPNLRFLMILDAFQVLKRTVTAFLDTVRGPLHHNNII